MSMMKLASRTCAALALSTLSFAGMGGVQPPDGDYGFLRADGTPVGSGKFGTGGTLAINAGTPGSPNWNRTAPPLGDGQYKPTPPDGRSLCIHLIDGIFTYEYSSTGRWSAQAR
jgi:hypothetical protein